MDEIDDLESRLRGIYSDVVIDHILRPRNTEPIPNPEGYAECLSGCNESMKIWLRIRNDVVTDSAFWTNGCAATIACGSMSAELVKGKSVRDALAITADDIIKALENLPEGNHHCAELAARALRAALMDGLSTERQPWKKLYRR